MKSKDISMTRARLLRAMIASGAFIGLNALSPVYGRAHEEWESGIPEDDIEQAQKAIARADYLAIFYPLWLGTMNALGRAGG